MLRAVVFIVLFAFGGVFIAFHVASAGTTGSLGGRILETKTRAPVVGAVVSVTSPSQTANTTTDSSGHFTFISLAPDTYQLGVTKQGFEQLQVPGITIQADQQRSLDFSLDRSLRQIARVAARSALDVVRPGTTTDVYSVNSAVTSAAAPIGGGGSLNNAYSAIAAVPGAFVPPGQMGVNQSVYIRGGYYDQIGYEYDGVPVNRSFDNYPGHSAATLGQQELQIYTGGGGAGASASGLAGFINQVVKSGSSPGFADFSARLGSPTFYHDFSAEAGGATTNRRFTYYVGASSYNQQFRYLDNFNGAGQIANFPNPVGPSNHTTNLDFYPAVYPTCNADLTSPFDASGVTPPPFANDPGCFASFNPVYSYVDAVDGREVVGNFHLAIPHHNDSGSDDIQLLYTNSAQYRQYYSGVNDAGFSLVQNAVGYGEWPDYVTYPTGTQFLAPATVQPIAYPFPGSPGGRCYNTGDYTDIYTAGSCQTGYSALPPDYRDARWDSASIVKLQYQKNIGSNAYVRLFGYTFYSNTNRSGASRRGIGSGFGATNYDYEVDSHTRGLELQFADQLSDHHQLTGSADYVTATTLRDNNFNYRNTKRFSVSNLTNGTQCFAAADGTGDDGVDAYTAGQPAPCNDSITQGSFYDPTQSETQGCGAGTTIPTPACAAGAAWRLTYTGNQAGINRVRPKFGAISLSDEWRPNDKLDIKLGLRGERDEFDLGNTNTPGKNFWYAAAQNEYCYNPVTLQPVFVPQAPQNASVQTPYVTFNCPLDNSTGTPVQTFHPDGKDGHLLLSNVYNPKLVQSYFLPQAGLTYNVDPNTVLRASAGRYAQQPRAYEIQYDSQEENLANQLIGFLPYGFTTPRHDALPEYSNNFDVSIEHQFPGTDLSFKATPYYRYATNQLYNATVYGQSPSFNSGIERTAGVEFELLKGDFKKNGLSALFSYTYTSSKERWLNYAGTNQNPVDPYNQYIQQYNALTKAGGGSPCYMNSADGKPDPACMAMSIRNPYYASTPQPLLDKNAYYETGLDFPYLSPNVFTTVLNYRSGKFAITPELSLNQGTTYGNPADVGGLDPRTCSQNQGTSGFTTGNPLNADYTSCAFAATPSGSLYVPNPETGHFDGFGEFRQPWQLNMGLQLAYDITPKVTANVTVANLVNRCFGGSSTPWSAAYPPSSSICGYGANIFYVNNFYNGASAHD
ncbi:MAG: TonB-dependent receptor, partial [Candidatus Eremiobacteraeota bacterium]|nr:TonB-dependent receptor [Candidatus Eremiobacteraeota bacterium]